jgi:hypothetical protein
MTLPETDLARVRRWVEARSARQSERARDQIRYELDVDDRAVTILECWPPWRADFGPEWTRFPIARLQYTKARREWRIYWRERNLEFHSYKSHHRQPTSRRSSPRSTRTPPASAVADHVATGPPPLNLRGEIQGGPPFGVTSGVIL